MNSVNEEFQFEINSDTYTHCILATEKTFLLNPLWILFKYAKKMTFSVTHPLK